METTKKSGFHYAWVVFVATVVMNFFFSVVYSTFSLYAASILTAHPGISRTAYSLVPTLHSVSATVFLLLYGKIVQKLSFRWVMLIGGLALGVGYFIYSVAETVAVFYIGALIVGIFPAFCSSTTTGALINRWYGKLNATLLSISMAIGGFGGTVGAIIVGRWLDTIGYQASFRNMGLLMAAVMIIVFLVVRNNPAEKNTTMLWPSEADKTATKQEERAGYTFKQAIKTYNFWAMVMFFVLYAAGFYAAYANVAVYMADLGWDATTYGAIFGVVATVNVITMVPGGFMADKLGPRGTIFILCVLYAIVCAIIGFTTPTTTVMYFVCGLIGVCYLFCKVLHTPLALCFGSRDSATLISILTAAVTVGACIGIPAANMVYDATGSYAGLFRILLVVLVICLVLAFTGIKKMPGWDKVGGPDAVEK
ncbi:MAG: MFS transporter [Oscillospiraceae bacterium]|nr:MFS transporter [Oscillospiraceae bacterium]